MLKPDPVMPKAYSYLRFSTPEQSRGDSFGRQADAAKAYAERHGLVLDESSFEDLGVSAFRGRNSDIGELGRFLEAVRDGVVEKGSYLLVESLDRISRDKPRKATNVLAEICEEDITVVTLTDGRRYDLDVIDNDPMAFMYAFMVAIRANEESETKSRRLKAAWERKRENAKDLPITKKCPLWLVPAPETKLGFTVNRKRANVVRRIFQLARDGVGQHKIAQTLNSEGIDTFGTAAYWQRSYVAKLLKNEAVIGTLIPHRIEYVNGKRTRIPASPVKGYYPAILPKEEFYEVQALIGSSPQRGRHASSAVRSILGGLARCPRCQGTMTRVSKGPKGGKVVLVCANAKQGGGCRYRGVPYQPVEEALLRDLETLREQAPRPGETGHLWERLRSTQMALDVALEEEERLYRALGSDATARDKLRLRDAQEVVRLEQDDKRAVERQIEEAQNTSVDAIIARLEALSEAEELDRKAINVELRKLLSGVTIDYEPHFESLRYHFNSGKSLPGPVYAAKPAEAL